MRMHNGENFALGRGNYEYLFAPAKKWLIAIPFLRGFSWWGRKMSGQEGREQSPFKGEREVREILRGRKHIEIEDRGLKLLRIPFWSHS